MEYPTGWMNPRLELTSLRISYQPQSYTQPLQPPQPPHPLHILYLIHKYKVRLTNESFHMISMGVYEIENISK